MKKVFLMIAMSLLVAGTSVHATSNVEVEKPSWLSDSEYSIIEGDTLYESSDWNIVLELREKLETSGTINETYIQTELKKEDISLAYAYELTLILDKYSESNGLHWNSLKAIRSAMSAQRCEDKNYVLLDARYYALYMFKIKGGFDATVQGEAIKDALKLGITKQKIYGHSLFNAYKSDDVFVEFINSYVIELNGTCMDMYPFAHIKSGATMVPLRAVVEAIGGQVDWEQETMTASINYVGTTIELIIGEDIAYVNGEPEQLPTTAYTVDGRTFIPIRFVSEHLGQTVDWYSGGLVSIYSEKLDYSNDPLVKFIVAITKAHTNKFTSYLEQDFTNADEWRESMASNWGVYDRESLISLIVRMTEEGHQNSMFLNEVEDVKSMSESELAELKELYYDGYMFDQLLMWDEQWGDVGVISYDLTRIILLSQWGYVCGYLTEEEALALAIPTVIKYKEIFSSIEDGVENYLDGVAWFFREDLSAENTTRATREANFNLFIARLGDLDEIYDFEVNERENVTYEDLRSEVTE